MNGILIVAKEKGYTSHDVVAKLRKIYGQKKIGHTGTLDPEAEGVLPICLGQATKVCDLLTEESKTYQALLCLGMVTDTQDGTGTILREETVSLEEQQVYEAIASFQGESMQVPPMYSALKINGKKLYDLARQGITVERKPRPITIFSLVPGEIEKREGKYFLPLTVSCSKGTYIRTLCYDIGEKLGCGGTMVALKRTRVGSFTLEQAKTLAVIAEYCEKGEGESLLTPVDSLFSQYPMVVLNNQREEGLVQNGSQVPGSSPCFFTLPNPGEWEDGFVVRIYSGETKNFLALYQYNKEKGWFWPRKMFIG